MEAPIPQQRNFNELKSKKMGIILILLLFLNILALIEILGCRNTTKSTTTEPTTEITQPTTNFIKSTTLTTETASTTTDQEVRITKQASITTTTTATDTEKSTTTQNDIVKNLLKMMKD